MTKKVSKKSALKFARAKFGVVYRNNKQEYTFTEKTSNYLVNYISSETYNGAVSKRSLYIANEALTLMGYDTIGIDKYNGYPELIMSLFLKDHENEEQTTPINRVN